MEPKIRELWLWCDTCKGVFRAYEITFSETRWALANPHDHDLRIGICPRTIWKAVDFKEHKFPQLTELFKLAEDVAKLKQLLAVLEELAEVEERSLEGETP